MRRKGLVSKQEIKKQLLQKKNPSSNPTHNSQNKLGGDVYSNNTSSSNKNKSATTIAVEKVTPPDSSTQPIVMENNEYNIVEDMKRAHSNISLFEIKIISSQWELIL